MNDRRKLVIALVGGALGMTRASFAQQPTPKVHRIGFLSLSSAASIASRLDAFRAGLRDLGYVEGKNIAIDYRWAEGKAEILPDLAAELASLKADVIFAQGPQATLAAKKVGPTIPIVFVGIGDPVATGIVTSLARPGGNVTGLTNLARDLSSKRLELLKESVPRILSVAVFWNGTSQGNLTLIKDSEIAARALKITLHPFEVRTVADFDGAFQAATKARADALMTLPDPFLNAHIQRVTEFAMKNRLPSIYTSAEFIDAGGLMAYGPNLVDQYGRAALFVDKILKGAKPYEIPVEQPTRFEIVINLKTAKALGIKIPQSVLLRADKVIQ